MELISLAQVWAGIGSYFVPAYLVVFMSTAYFAREWVHSAVQYFFGQKIKKHHLAVFIIGSIAAIPFWINGDYDRMKLLQTYTLGTAIHSHLFQFVISYINKFKKKV